jgi:hypothetical protein
MLSNESTVPSRVVAGPSTTPATLASHPTSAAVTRGGITVSAAIPADTVTAGAQVPVTITTAGLLDFLPPALHLQVCIVEPPIGEGWTGFDPGPSCAAHDVAYRSTQLVALTAPAQAGDYAVFLRWSKPPSGEFLPVPLHVVPVTPSAP